MEKWLHVFQNYNEMHSWLSGKANLTFLVYDNKAGHIYPQLSGKKLMERALVALEFNPEEELLIATKSPSNEGAVMKVINARASGYFHPNNLLKYNNKQYILLYDRDGGG